MHIPPHKLLPQDLVDMLDHGPADALNEPPVKLRMNAQDARHAMQVEPERYTLTPDEAPVVAEPETASEPAEVEDDI